MSPIAFATAHASQQALKSRRLPTEPLFVFLLTQRAFSVTTDVPKTVSMGYCSQRRKDRVQYDHPNSAWLIHLTQVTSGKEVVASQDDAVVQAEITYEIEFELKNAQPMAELEARRKVLREVFSILLNLMGDRLEMFLEDINPPFIPILQKICWDAVRPNPKGEYRNDGFPGSMPVSFSRRHFQELENSEYLISEKTDGIRYMMLIVNGGIFMVDRKFDLQRLISFDPFLLTISQPGPTLLDGELVQPLNGTSKLAYMVFDIVQCQGEIVSHFPLTKRLAFVGMNPI